MTTVLLIMLTTVAIAGFVLQSLALIRVKHSQQEQAENYRDCRQRLTQVEQELAALCTASVGAGDHVVKLEQQVKRIIERQNMLELRASNDRPYAQASQLVHKGADIEELVDTCGLTRGEAELLVMMQRGAA